MSTPARHPAEEILLAYTSGHLGDALRLMVEVHASRCEVCAESLGALSEPGAAVLASMPKVELPAGLFDRILGAVEALPPTQPMDVP